mmetsp:Transcript_41513/g.124067  ORF Transcript_41513/g.124067 Transcript_41513/m.124067 type:complete len:232 (+) Transcript_41513:150-845(+)
MATCICIGNVHTHWPSLRLLVLVIRELSVNHIVVALLLLTAGLGAAWCGTLWLLRVHGLTHGHDLLLQLVHGRLHGSHILRRHRRLQRLDLVINLGLNLCRHLLAKLLDLLLCLVDHRLSLVLGVDGLAALLILLCKRLSVLDHALNIVLVQRRCARDLDVLLLARALVGRCHRQDAVGVNVKHNINLGHATRRRRDARQLELAKQVVVLGARTLALIHLDEDARLVVRVG